MLEEGEGKGGRGGLYITPRQRDVYHFISASSTWARVGLHLPYLPLYRFRQLNRAGFSTYT